jgi:ParB-like chromosome segregation protein Spo0J
VNIDPDQDSMFGPETSIDTSEAVENTSPLDHAYDSAQHLDPLASSTLVMLEEHWDPSRTIAPLEIPKFSKFEYLSLHQVQLRDQFREATNLDADEALLDDVRSRGIVNPIIVAEMPDGFRTIIGDRRVEAARGANLEKIPARVIRLGDSNVDRVRELELILAEDIHHSPFNALELTDIVLETVACIIQVERDVILKTLQRASHLRARDVPRTPADLVILEVLDSMLAPTGLARETFRREYVPLLCAPQDVRFAVQSGVSHSLAIVIARVEDVVRRAAMIEDAKAGILTVRAAKAEIGIEPKQKRKSGLNKTRPSVFAELGGRVDRLIRAQPGLEHNPDVVRCHKLLTRLLGIVEQNRVS